VETAGKNYGKNDGLLSEKIEKDHKNRSRIKVLMLYRLHKNCLSNCSSYYVTASMSHNATFIHLFVNSTQLRIDNGVSTKVSIVVFITSHTMEERRKRPSNCPVG